MTTTTPYRALEVLGQLRLFGLRADHFADGCIAVRADGAELWTVNPSGDRWVVRSSASEECATVPLHWGAEAVAAAVVCVVMLGATGTDGGSDVDGPNGPSTSGATSVAEYVAESMACGEQ